MGICFRQHFSLNWSVKKVVTSQNFIFFPNFKNFIKRNLKFRFFETVPEKIDFDVEFIG